MTETKKKAVATSAITPQFRVSYPNVLKARKNDLNGKDEYSVMAVFAIEADLTALKEACAAAMAKKFGADKSRWPKQYRTPFRNQADRGKEGEDGKLVMPDGMVEGAIYINLRTTQAPAVVNQAVKPITEEKDFYAGCYAIAKVNAYAYGGPGIAPGVNLGLVSLMKVKEGEPLGNRTRPEDDFKPIEGFEGADGNDPASMLGQL